MRMRVAQNMIPPPLVMFVLSSTISTNVRPVTHQSLRIIYDVWRAEVTRHPDPSSRPHRSAIALSDRGANYEQFMKVSPPSPVL